MQHLKLAVEARDEDQREDRLRRAHEVLTRAIVENRQSDNPGAWYYLGRYFMYKRDPIGADSAFRNALELAPECADDIRSYVGRLQPDVRSAALRNWQEGRLDSATMLFHLARSLGPDDAEVPFFMAMMYTAEKQFDSASKYVGVGVELAGGDPALEQRQRQAMLDLVRGREAEAFEEPAVGQLMQSRVRRDSLGKAIREDSVRLAKLNAEWAGKRLRPNVRQAVQRDSTMLADRIAAARAALPAALEAAERDSAAATAAFAPTLQSYEGFLEQYPGDGETALRLLRRYSMMGHTTSMDRMIDRLAGLEDVDVPSLTQAGASIFNDGFPQQAAKLLGVSADRNPHFQSTHAARARVYYALGDAEQLTDVARRLIAIDPLNPQSVRMMAAAWDLAGNTDSVRKYVALADSGIGWGVTVTQFAPTASGALVNGSVANMTPRQLGPTTLQFEFLDDQGNVLATVPADIPALEPRRRHALSVRTDVGGVAAWRYRRP
jgi:tetratricopeptide (TPR) repeat protein